MKQGLISVIVPVYNAEVTIAACVNSILGQSYANVEVVLVNDGSIDGSLGICEDLAAGDRRVMLLSQENAGPSAARNNGIEHASGEYIAFVDSDDRIESQMFERLVQPLKNGASLSCCGVVKSANGDEQLLPICEHDATVDFRTYLNDMLLSPLAGYACNRLYPRDLIGETRFPVDLRFAEDLVFNCVLWSGVQEVAYVSDCLYIYEQRQDSLTSSADAYIVDGKWVFSSLTPRLASVLSDEPWIEELLSYRNAARALDGIRLLSGNAQYADVRAELVQEFRADEDVYLRHQQSPLKRLLAWLTVALPESVVRLGVSLLGRD